MGRWTQPNLIPEKPVRGHLRGERETALVRACLELLQLRGLLAWRQNQGAVKHDDPRARLGYRFVKFAEVDGISDIIGATKDGRLLAIEAKIWPGKPTPHQLRFLAAVKLAGGEALIIYAVDQLDAWIRTGVLPPYRPPRRRILN
jgi:hypothetical protein